MCNEHLQHRIARLPLVERDENLIGALDLTADEACLR